MLLQLLSINFSLKYFICVISCKRADNLVLLPCWLWFCCSKQSHVPPSSPSWTRCQPQPSCVSLVSVQLTPSIHQCLSQETPANMGLLPVQEDPLPILIHTVLLDDFSSSKYLHSTDKKFSFLYLWKASFDYLSLTIIYKSFSTTTDLIEF